MYVFGGLNEEQSSFSDLFALNCENWTWTSIGKFTVDGTNIKACGHVSASFDTNLLVFGGLDPESTTIYNQMFVYNTTEKSWGRVEERKSPRFCGSMAIKDQKIILFGGCNLVNRSVPGIEELEITFARIGLKRMMTSLPKIPRDIYGNPVDVTKPHQKSKLTHLTDAEEWVHKIPPIIVNDDVVRCGGVKATGLGHPLVYLQLNKRDPTQPEVCKWCGLRYLRNPHLNH